MTTLLIQSSARTEGSVTRKLARKLAEGFGAPVATRDISNGLPVISADWVAANGTDPSERSDAQREVLSQSDSLVAELRDADRIVISAPLYNFSIPASLKSWIDLVARARETFRYTETGPEGLLKGKKAYIVAASGGVPVGSPVDFATPYLRHVLGFLGIDDVNIIAADQLIAKGGDSVTAAEIAVADVLTKEAA